MKENKFKLLGKWPADGRLARKKKEMMVVRVGETLDFVHGEKNHILVSFFVSNDFIHVGKLAVPPNGYSDLERHRGDELIYCLKGRISVVIESEEKSGSVTSRRLEAFEGEKIFIPEGIGHRYYNFTDESADVIFAVAPLY